MFRAPDGGRHSLFPLTLDIEVRQRTVDVTKVNPNAKIAEHFCRITAGKRKLIRLECSELLRATLSCFHKLTEVKVNDARRDRAADILDTILIREILIEQVGELELRKPVGVGDAHFLPFLKSQSGWIPK